MKPIALVPAKGYSERLTRKNLRPLGGRPLLAWTVEVAQAAGIFSAVWVSSESDEVLDLARDLGANALLRPGELAQPDATVSDVILHTRRALEHSGPITVLVPSSPFRSAFRLTAAWDKFRLLPRAGALISLRPLEHPPEWSFRFDTVSGDITPVVRELVDTPRSALRKAWRHDGAYFFLGSANHEGAVIGFENDPLEAIDINTLEDLAYAEYLLTTGQIPWIRKPS